MEGDFNLQETQSKIGFSYGIKNSNFLLAVLFIFIFVSLAGFIHTTSAAPNYEINYQGKLTNTSNVAVSNDTYNIRFWLTTSPTIATTSAVWTEELTGTNKVQVTNGLFSIMLGSTTPLTGVDFNQTLYLGVEIGGTSTPAWDGEMSPRKILGTVPSAFEAENARTIDNLATTSLLRSDVDDTASGLLTFTGGLISNSSTTITNLTTDIATTTTLVTTYININGTTFDSLMGNGLTLSSNDLTCRTASDSQFGCLTATDWTIFNGKISSTSLDTSVELAALLGDETGTGYSVFSTNPLLSGFRSFASSTIGDGTGAGGLTVLGNSTTTGGAYFVGNVGIGTSTATTKVGIQNLNASGDLLSFYDNTGMRIGGFVDGAGFANVFQWGNNGGGAYLTTIDGSGIGSYTVRAECTVLCGPTAPAYKFGYDVTTGFYSPSAGNLGITTGGVNRLFINSNGISIGTTTPYAKLSIQSDYGATGLLFDIATTTSSGYATSSIFRVGADGRVGIGTTSPSTLLGVQGTVTASNFIAYSTTSTTTLAGGLDVGNGGLVYDLESGETYIGSLISGTQTFDYDAGTVQWTDLPVWSAGLDTPQSYTASIGGNEMLTIYGLSSGASTTYNNMVGIGSSTPSRFFTVAGDSYFTNNITSASSTLGYATSTALYTNTFGLGSDYITDLTGIGLSVTNGILNVTGDGLSNWLTQEGALTPSTTLGIRINASSTIGDGTGAGGLTVYGNSTTTGSSYFAGNVGIGTTMNPSSLLEISRFGGGGAILGASRLLTLTDTNGSVGNRTEIGMGGFGASNVTYRPVIVGTKTRSDGGYGNADFYIATRLSVTDTAPIERFYITATGTIGIGTTTPESTLTIQGSGTTNPFAIASSTGSSMFTVLANGNVGIGSSTPVATLGVAGGGYFTGTIYANGKTLIGYDSNLNSGVGGTFSAGSYEINGGGGVTVSDGLSNLNLTAGSGKITIARTGNVGIGTTSPSAKLAIHAKNGETNPYLFTIASSTASATTSLFTVLANGDINVGSSAGFRDGGSGNLTIIRSWDGTSGSLTAGAGILTPSVYSNSSSAGLSIGNSALSNVSVPAAVYLASGVYSQTSSPVGGFAATFINPTYNQSGSTAANTDLSILRTETAIGSGAQYLINAQTGGSLNSWATTTKFSVDRTGQGYFAGNLGLGSSTPSRLLTVNGDAIMANLMATGTATTTNLAITGMLYDGAGTAGTNGYVLQTTGTGVQWVATSTLGLGGGSSADGMSNWLTQEGALTPSTTLGIRINASSTIGDGTGAGGLTILGNSTTTGDAYFMGSTLSVGTTTSTSSAKLFLDGAFRLTSSNGAIVIGDTSGNARGGDSIDIQSYRLNSTEVASGGLSVAVGIRNTVKGWTSAVLGYDNFIDTADDAYAVGGGNIINATVGYTGISAFGYSNTIDSPSNDTSAFGNQNYVKGSFSNSFGYANNISRAPGDSSNTFGAYNTIDDGAASAFGIYNIIGDGAYGGSAFGYGNIATTSDYASAFGYGNLASGTSSSAFGASTTVSGMYASAFGYNNIASAQGATAIGSYIINDIASSTMIGPSDSSKLTILSSGNFGIGTSSPLSTLTIQGSGTTNPFTIASSSGSSMLTVLANGYVGIGKATPADALDVLGAISATGGLSTGGSVNVAYSTSSNSENWAYQGSSYYSTVYAYNQQAADNRGAFNLFVVKNSNANTQNAFIGAVSNTGVSQYSPSIVFGQQTGATSYQERMRIDSTGNVGIGTSTPSRTLTVAGDSFFQNNITAASSTFTNATLTYASTTALTVSGNSYFNFASSSYASTTGLTVQGNLHVASLADGCLSTVSGLVTSSGVACVTGGGSSNWLTQNGALTPSTTLGIRINASSTIGDGTGTGGLTILGNSTTTGDAYFGGKVSLGSTTPSSLAKLIMDGSMSSSGSTNAIAGEHYIFTFNPSSNNTTQVGNRLVVLNSPSGTATNTSVAQIIRTIDNSGISNLVRGLEISSSGGTNTYGVNTGLRSTGHTFGVQGITTGLAGGTSTPAALYGQNTGTTQGDILRLYTATMTSAPQMAQFYQEASAFTGAGLLMNFGAGGGTFTGNFLDLQVNENSRFTVTAGGTTTIGQLNQTSTMAGLQIGYGGLCVDNDGLCTATTTGRISAVSYTTGASDLAENYYSDELLETGDIVRTKGRYSISLATDAQDPIIGVVSTKPGMVLGEGEVKQEVGTAYPVGLSGRVPVKVSDQNGEVKVGDRIVLSSVSGVGMKATGASGETVVGIALEDFDGSFYRSKATVEDETKVVMSDTSVCVARTVEGGGKNSGGSDSEGVLSGVGSVATTTEEICEKTKVNVVPEAGDAQRVATAGGEVKVGKILLFINLQRGFAFASSTLLGGATSSDSLLGTQTSPLGSLRDMLTQFGMYVSETLVQIKNLVVEKLTIGSSEKPTGITLFDTETGLPYCLTIANGATKTTEGECGVIQTPIEPDTTGGNTGGAEVPPPEAPLPEGDTSPSEVVEPVSTTIDSGESVPAEENVSAETPPETPLETPPESTPSEITPPESAPAPSENTEPAVAESPSEPAPEPTL